MSRATAYLHFRATDVQKAEIVKAAKAEGKTLSAYLLERALATNIIELDERECGLIKSALGRWTNPGVAELLAKVKALY